MIKKPFNNGLVSALSKTGQRPQFEPKPRRQRQDRRRPGQINMTFWMALSTNKALRQLAETREISMQDLVASFVDKGLAEAGEAPFKFKDE